MSKFKGSHRVLANLNIIATILVLHFFAVDILHIGREKFEGLAYNVAWSSQYGDKALIAVIALAVLILQRPGHLPSWLTGGTYHIVCGMLAVAVGVALVAIPNPYTRQQIMDNYHNFFVVGLFLYLLATTIPVIYRGGTTAEKYVAVLLLAFWAVLVVADFKTGRIEQRQWLQNQGVVFPK